jgi:hypothetical protein
VLVLLLVILKILWFLPLQLAGDPELFPEDSGIPPQNGFTHVSVFLGGVFANNFQNCAQQNGVRGT